MPCRELVGAELAIHVGDLRHRETVAVGHDVGRGGTIVVSDLPAGHGLAGTAGPQWAIEECGDPCAASRGGRVTPSGAQTATVPGRALSSTWN